MSANVLIVTEVRLYREGLERLFSDEPRINVVGNASSRVETVAAVSTLNPDIILIDMAMRESLIVVEQMANAVPCMKIVALGITEVDSEVIACAEAGISGYVTRQGSLRELVECVEASARGEFRCSQKMSAALLGRVKALASSPLNREPQSCLTRREAQILEFIDQGLSNKEIARGLKIEVSTVKNHIHNILEKLNVRSRGEASAWMRRQYGSSPPTGPGRRSGAGIYMIQNISLDPMIRPIDQ